MRKNKTPALYELIATKQTQEITPEEISTQPPPEDVNLEHNVLTPGQPVRISIGTIGVIVAVCIALIVISYTMGFQRGSDIAREDYGNGLIEKRPESTPATMVETTRPASAPNK